jgi:hypothetical protein
MSRSLLDPGDHCTLQYIVTHIFCSLQLPDGGDQSIRNDRSLAGAISSVMRLYSDHVDQANMAQWRSIVRMLDNLQAVVQSESLDRFQLSLSSAAWTWEVNFPASAVSQKLIMCRCSRISCSSPKCGGLIQKAEGCDHFRVLRGIPEG